MKKGLLLILVLLLTSCAVSPLPETLPLKHPPRLAIIGFKITAPIKKLSSIVENPPENLSAGEEARLISEHLRGVEDKATSVLIEDLRQSRKVEPVAVPEGLYGTRRGEAPTPEELEMLREGLGADAVLYGQIPWYGKTRPIYPILGETLDIAAETLIIGFATHWNSALIFGNIGFELLTSTPLWFGGAYVFGWAFRPVTVEASVVSAVDGKEAWHDSVDRILSRKTLKTYPESERSKKEVQLEASLRSAILALSGSLAGEADQEADAPAPLLKNPSGSPSP